MHIAGNGKYNSFNKTKVNNKWVMLVILIIIDVNKSHVTYSDAKKIKAVLCKTKWEKVLEIILIRKTFENNSFWLN